MPRYYRPKSLQKIVIETVLFVTVFTLIGHFAVNFWERHMIQSEISKMKSSLYAMKDTINTIGVAYDDLHTELVGLSLIVEQQPRPPVQKNKPKSKNQSTLDRKTVNDLEVQVMELSKIYNDQKIGIAPFTVNQTTQNFLQEFKVCKNATTIANCLHSRAKVRHDKESSAIPTIHHKNEEAVRVIPVPDVKNVATITRYPLKSTAVGNTVPRYEETCRYWDYKENRCCDDDNCESGFWRF